MHALSCRALPCVCGRQAAPREERPRPPPPPPAHAATGTGKATRCISSMSSRACSWPPRTARRPSTFCRTRHAAAAAARATAGLAASRLRPAGCGRQPGPAGEVHRQQYSSWLSTPPLLLAQHHTSTPRPQQDPMAYEQLIKTAEDFIARRALTHVGAISPQPVVHIVKVGRVVAPGWAGLGREASGLSLWGQKVAAAPRARRRRGRGRGRGGQGRCSLTLSFPPLPPSLPPFPLQRSTRSTPTQSATWCARRPRSWRRRSPCWRGTGGRCGALADGMVWLCRAAAGLPGLPAGPAQPVAAAPAPPDLPRPCSLPPTYPPAASRGCKSGSWAPSPTFACTTARGPCWCTAACCDGGSSSNSRVA